MKTFPYTRKELHFAYSYQVYLRWHTHRLQAQPQLARFTSEELADLAAPYGIRILEFEGSDTEALALVSLSPEEAVAACASKLKGRVSGWLKEAIGLERPAALLGKGYFARTAGKSTRDAVEAYLGRQGDHHGYARRVIPPVFVESYALTFSDEERLNAPHSKAVLQFHIVLASWHRHGVFGQESGEMIARFWRGMQNVYRFALLKVSFVPDHVHLAVRVHPSVSPADLVLELMNAAQETMFRELPEHIIQADISRLWQPSGYVGAYGDVTAARMKGYVGKWGRAP